MGKYKAKFKNFDRSNLDRARQRLQDAAHSYTPSYDYQASKDGMEQLSQFHSDVEVFMNTGDFPDIDDVLKRAKATLSKINTMHFKR